MITNAFIIFNIGVIKFMLYVDEYYKEIKGNKCCHLMSDNIEELKSVGTKLGLQPYHLRHTLVPHFDITEKKRKQAIQIHGATEVDKTFLWSLMKKK